jgi:predicted transcriptional regulator
MTISLNAQTQKLLEEQMKKHGCSTVEETVQLALEKLDEEPGDFIDDLDPATQAAIAEGLAQSERGEGRPWEQVRQEIRARFTKA